MLVFVVLYIALISLAATIIGFLVLGLALIGYLVGKGRPIWRRICITLMLIGGIVGIAGALVFSDPAGFIGIPKPAEKAPDIIGAE